MLRFRNVILCSLHQLCYLVVRHVAIRFPRGTWFAIRHSSFSAVAASPEKAMQSLATASVPALAVSSILHLPFRFIRSHVAPFIRIVYFT
jgi:hypothetical protein